MAKVKIIEDKSVIYERTLEQVMHDSMMPYAESVILERAIPRVEDGLKPVQRRILYSMYELGTLPDKQHRKCARIVGDCLGKYHPHGDSSVYGALVFMAQPFNMRRVLVDGHGNFGSVDGDGAAAMRYTEARLSPLALELLRDIDKDTVDMQWNFDDTCKEPVTLPGHFPNLLVNGCPYGIAVGLATSIPPHNLNEVVDGTIALIDKPKMPLKELMEYIKAPDFPTGGTIICGEDLVTAYETGKGKVTMRAKIHIEEEASDKKSIVITELPYQVVKAKLLQQILKLREDKKDMLAGISDIVDESDRNGMRAVIKVRRDADAEKIVRILLKQTNLECNFSMNMVAIADGKPKQMGLIEILTYYIDYQRQVIVRRAAFDLKAAKLRAEVVEGLLIAIANIDEVIRIIKAAKTVSEASEKLRARFGLSERQAQAILEMKLRRLTGLDVDELKVELADLKKKIEDLTELLASKRRQNALMKEELTEVKKAYKTPRQSVIAAEGKEEEIKVQSEDETSYREGVIVLNENGTLKVVPTRSFAMSPRAVSEATSVTAVRQALASNNRQTVLALSNLGNCYKLSIDDFPDKKWKDKGATVASLNKDAAATERIVKLYASESFPTGEVLIFTKQGFVKRTSWLDLNVSKSSYKVINLSDGDEVISVETAEENSTIFMATEGGMCLAYALDEVPVQGRIAGGVRGIKLGDGDVVIQAKQIGEEGEIVVFSDRGFGKRVFAFSFEPIKRYNKGVKLIDLGDGAKVAYADYVTDPFDVLVTEGDNATGFNTEQIPIDSRTGRGKLLVKGAGKLKVCRHVVESSK